MKRLLGLTLVGAALAAAYVAIGFLGGGDGRVPAWLRTDRPRDDGPGVPIAYEAPGKP